MMLGFCYKCEELFSLLNVEWDDIENEPLCPNCNSYLNIEDYFDYYEDIGFKAIKIGDM